MVHSQYQTVSLVRPQEDRKKLLLAPGKVFSLARFNAFGMASEVDDSQLKEWITVCISRALFCVGWMPLLIPVFWAQDERLYVRKHSERNVSRHRLQKDRLGIFEYAPFDVFALPLQSGLSFVYLQ